MRQLLLLAVLLAPSACQVRPSPADSKGATEPALREVLRQALSEGVMHATALEEVADVDGDGIVDYLAILDMFSHPIENRLALVSAGTGSVLESIGLGCCLSPSVLIVVPDVDGDGLADGVVAQGYGDGRDQRPRLRAYSTGSLNEPLWELSGEAVGPATALGRSACLVPDRDDDGLADLLVGAPSVRAEVPGATVVISTRTGEILAVTSDPGGRPGYGIGVALLSGGTAGDLELVLCGGHSAISPFDCYRQFAENCPHSEVLIARELGRGIAWERTLGPPFQGPGRPGMVALAGVTRNGGPGVAVSRGAGRVEIFDANSGEPVHQLSGEPSNRQCAGEMALASPGDLTGDGCSEILVGLPGATVDAVFECGLVQLWSSTGELLAEQVGSEINGAVGGFLTVGSDRDGDRRADLISGTEGSAMYGAGSIRVFSLADRVRTPGR